MLIYTKTGDDGTTTCGRKKRLLKSEPQLETIGTIDELSAFIGYGLCKVQNHNDKKLLTEIQKDLYFIMSGLANCKTDSNWKSNIKKFEQYIDREQKKLPKLHAFLLPQGKEVSCIFHITRTICRRAERMLVKLNRQKNSQIIIYLNRLSDLFFIMARKYNNY